MEAAALIDFLLTATLSSFIFALPLVAVLAFASTNVDDLFLLASLFVDKEFRTMPVVAGQFLGMSLLVAFSVLAAFFAISSAGRDALAAGRYSNVVRSRTRRSSLPSVPRLFL